MDFLSGMIFGGMTSNYRRAPDYSSEINNLAEKIEDQNEVIEKLGEKNVELKNLIINIEYFKKYTDEELIELLKRVPQYVENEYITTLTGGVGGKALYEGRRSVKEKNKKYQDILREVKRRKLEFE